MLTEKNKLRIFKQIPSEKPNTPLLDVINSPSDLKTFSIKELETLSDELREFLLYSVGKSGGHLGGGLGVIELTIIIHHLFDQCKSTDKIISIFNKFAEKYMIIEQIPDIVNETKLILSLNKYNWKIEKIVPSPPVMNPN